MAGIDQPGKGKLTLVTAKGVLQPKDNLTEHGISVLLLLVRSQSCE